MVTVCEAVVSSGLSLETGLRVVVSSIEMSEILGSVVVVIDLSETVVELSSGISVGEPIFTILSSTTSEISFIFVVSLTGTDSVVFIVPSLTLEVTPIVVDSRMTASVVVCIEPLVSDIDFDGSVVSLKILGSVVVTGCETVVSSGLSLETDLRVVVSSIEISEILGSVVVEYSISGVVSIFLVDLVAVESVSSFGEPVISEAIVDIMLDKVVDSTESTGVAVSLTTGTPFV